MACLLLGQNHPTRNGLLEEEISATTEEDFATRCPVDRRTIIYCHWGFYSDQMADGYVVRFPNFLLYSRGTRLGEMVQQCVPWITDVGDSIQRAKMACPTSQDISWIQNTLYPKHQERMVLYAASCFSPHWALVAFHVSPREHQAPPPPAWLRKRPPTNVRIFMGIHIFLGIWYQLKHFAGT